MPAGVKKIFVVGRKPIEHEEFLGSQVAAEGGLDDRQGGGFAYGDHGKLSRIS